MPRLKMTLLLGAPVLSLLFAASAYAKDEPKKSTGHCEKVVDGKTVDLDDVTNRKDCKKKGGKWSSKSKHAHHDEGEHEDEEHKDD